MLRKLLKYDFKAVMKYWWIAALTSFVLSYIGGILLALVDSDREFPAIIYAMAVIGLILVIVSYVVFSILSLIFVYSRFYKNFFTDEGYLTFTLPVRRSQLLNSKLIVSVVTIILTTVVCIINIFLLLMTAFADKIFTVSFWQDMNEAFRELSGILGAYLSVYLVELLIISILAVVCSCLFFFCCITFASIITKKAKVLAAIGIYYVANGIVTSCTQIFFMFGLSSLDTWLTALPEQASMGVVVFILLGLIAFLSILCSLLYLLQYWMLDRKLNLN